MRSIWIGISLFLGLSVLTILVIGTPIIWRQIDYHCFYCNSQRSGWGLLFLDFTPDCAGCLRGPQLNHSWAPITVSYLGGHYHTTFKLVQHGGNNYTVNGRPE